MLKTFEISYLTLQYYTIYCSEGRLHGALSICDGFNAMSQALEA